VGAARGGSLPAATVSDADQELREYLAEWRRSTAKEQGVPAYVVLHDSSLNEICQMKPRSIGELLEITGIGERKADLYGTAILAALQQYREGARAEARAARRTAPALETLGLLGEGKSLEEIAEIRGRQLSTVVNTVATLVESGQVEFQAAWIDPNKQSVITAACSGVDVAKLQRLKPLKESLPPEITYDEIRLVLSHLRREAGKSKTSIPA